MLQGIPSLEEVKASVWDLSPTSVAGPDGYPGSFYRRFWHVIQHDVHKAVQEFYLRFRMPKPTATATIILIPKVCNPQNFADYRPICLTNFISKVITRLLASRLAKILPKVISPEQAGFLQGRGITEQVLLAQEMVHFLDKRTRGGQVIIKLDMTKAFDRISWQYLQLLLRKLGMDERLVRILINNLSATNCSILLNVSLTSSFSLGRGVKQGDPLSPLLFILSSEGFSRGLNDLMQTRALLGFKADRVPCISHLGFADDLLIFLNGASHNLARFRKFLETYQKASRQLVNYNKSQFVVGQGVSVHNTLAALGMRSTSLPIKYLGSYLYKGINKARYCSPLINHFDAKLSAWSTKLLSMVGRIILIKYVLNTIPTHLIASSKLPKGVINTLNRKMAAFLWKGRHHWKSWSSVCHGVEIGGLGIRNLTHVQKAYDCQLWWKYFQSKTLWSEFSRAKYGQRPSTYSHIYDSSTWKRICRINEYMELHTIRSQGTLHWVPDEHG